MPRPQYTIDMLQPVVTTGRQVTSYDQIGAVTPNGDDLPTVTVTGHFDWKFWAAVGLGIYALYILTRSTSRAARHG